MKLEWKLYDAFRSYQQAMYAAMDLRGRPGEGIFPGYRTRAKIMDEGEVSELPWEVWVQRGAKIARRNPSSSVRLWKALEMSLLSGQPTGREEEYLARSPQEAAKMVLYQRRLSDRSWRLSPTKLVVSRPTGDKAWIIESLRGNPNAKLRSLAGAKVRLLRSFWGHKAGKIGKIDQRGHLRLKGSPAAIVRTSDLGDLFKIIG